MGQKVNPVGLRLGINQRWKSRWFSDKDYPILIGEDLRVRNYINQKLPHAGISRVEIERSVNQIKVDIYTARPGVVIGRRGSEVDALKQKLEKMSSKEVQINIQEVPRPELDATLIAQNVAEQLVARVSFRRAMKRAVNGALKSGALGVKISCAGRLGGAEMARREWYREGRVPLHTLRADIDYGFATARTKFGSIGVKVWIYRGDILKRSVEEVETEEKEKKGRQPTTRVIEDQVHKIPKLVEGPKEKVREVREVKEEAKKAKEVEKTGKEAEKGRKAKREAKKETKTEEVAKEDKKKTKPTGKGSKKSKEAKKIATKSKAKAKKSKTEKKSNSQKSQSSKNK